MSIESAIAQGIAVVGPPAAQFVARLIRDAVNAGDKQAETVAAELKLLMPEESASRDAQERIEDAEDEAP